MTFERNYNSIVAELDDEYGIPEFNYDKPFSRNVEKWVVLACNLPATTRKHHISTWIKSESDGRSNEFTQRVGHISSKQLQELEQFETAQAYFQVLKKYEVKYEYGGGDNQRFPAYKNILGKNEVFPSRALCKFVINALQDDSNSIRVDTKENEDSLFLAAGEHIRLAVWGLLQTLADSLRAIGDFQPYSIASTRDQGDGPLFEETILRSLAARVKVKYSQEFKFLKQLQDELFKEAKAGNVRSAHWKLEAMDWGDLFLIPQQEILVQIPEKSVRVRAKPVQFKIEMLPIK